MVISTWQAVNKVKFGDEIVHISTTVRATAKPFTPMCSPSGSDNQKNCDFPIWTTLWPYFFMVLATWQAVNKVNLKMKLCVSQQPLELRQNHLHFCVHQVVAIVRKIVIFRFEQLRDLIFYGHSHFWQAVNKEMKLCVSQQPLELRKNHLHLCVHQVVGIIRKIVIFRFEQVRDLSNCMH